MKKWKKQIMAVLAAALCLCLTVVPTVSAKAMTEDEFTKAKEDAIAEIEKYTEPLLEDIEVLYSQNSIGQEDYEKATKEIGEKKAETVDVINNMSYEESGLDAAQVTEKLNDGKTAIDDIFIPVYRIGVTNWVDEAEKSALAFFDTDDVKNYLSEEEKAAYRSDVSAKADSARTEITKVSTKKEITEAYETYAGQIFTLQLQKQCISVKYELDEYAKGIKAKIDGLILTEAQKAELKAKADAVLAEAESKLENVEAFLELGELTDIYIGELEGALIEAKQADPRYAVEERVVQASADAMDEIAGMGLSDEDRIGYYDGLDTLMYEALDRIWAGGSLQEAEAAEADFNAALANFIKSIRDTLPKPAEPAAPEKPATQSKLVRIKNVPKTGNAGDGGALMLAIAAGGLLAAASVRRRAR